MTDEMNLPPPVPTKTRLERWLPLSAVVLATAYLIWVLARPDVTPYPTSYRVVGLMYPAVMLAYVVWGVRRARRDRVARQDVPRA